MVYRNLTQEQKQRIIARAYERCKAAYDRKRIREVSKRESTLFNAVQRVKEVSEPSCWCTSHENCFRISNCDSVESLDHIIEKFLVFLENRFEGRSVFTETRLKDGSRPDVITCGCNGEVEIIEIVQSESNESIEKKENKYPFKMRVVRC